MSGTVQTYSLNQAFNCDETPLIIPDILAYRGSYGPLGQLAVGSAVLTPTNPMPADDDVTVQPTDAFADVSQPSG